MHLVCSLLRLPFVFNSGLLFSWVNSLVLLFCWNRVKSISLQPTTLSLRASHRQNWKHLLFSAIVLISSLHAGRVCAAVVRGRRWRRKRKSHYHLCNRLTLIIATIHYIANTVLYERADILYITRHVDVIIKERMQQRDACWSECCCWLERLLVVFIVCVL